MANSKFDFCFLVLFVVSYGILLMTTSCLGDVCQPKQHAALFVFGDSFFDVGSNNYINTTAGYQANFFPYGETLFKYSTGRFSDGHVIPDFIAEYAKLPLIPPYLFPGYQLYINGVNFASGGAGALVETNQGLVIDLKTQLSYFKKVKKVLRQELGDAETTTLLAKAVYLINIGTNDYLVPLSKNSSVFTPDTAAEKYVDMVVGNLSTVIKGIHQTGGRKFGILNQPALGCIPLVKALVNGSEGSCVEETLALAKLHNSVLSAELEKLKKQLKGFKYSFFDFYSISFDVINNPSKHGFKEGGVACCGSGPHREYYSCGTVKDYYLCEDPSEYVFFDSVHPTERLDQILSQLIWSGNQSVTGPYNLKTLLFEE